ncbi:MAG: hypothetical protein RIS64_889 [Bacteroidota bacterium]|jgi:uncharacterized protein
MKWLLLGLIQIYWQRPDRFKTRCCHFKETCSKHVYRITMERGFWAGLKAFQTRFNQCRGGYAVFKIDDTEFILWRDKTIIERTETIL